jgi:hypothetical protein
MRLSAYGIEVDLPSGWEGQIYRRPGGGRPILHAGSFALPAGDGDFGSLAVGALGAGSSFVALLEYDPALAGTGLFARRGMPLPLRVAEAHARAMPRAVAGRAAVQRFFTESGRAFCLYVVISAPAGASRAVREANTVLATVRIAPAPDQVWTEATGSADAAGSAGSTDAAGGGG